MSEWIGTGREMVGLPLLMAGNQKQASIIKDGIMVTARPIYSISLPWALLLILLVRQDIRNGPRLLNGKKSITLSIYMQVRFSFIKCLSYGLISGGFMIGSIKNSE